MKTAKFVLFILCLPCFIEAQITINNGDLDFNTATEVVDFTTVNITSIAVPQDGVDMIWDYSTLTTDSDYSITFQGTTNNQLCASNLKTPTYSTLMGNYLPAFKHLYYSNDGVRLEGFEQTPINISLASITGNPADNLSFLGDDLHYTNPEYDIVFPIQYNDVFISTNQDTMGYVANVAAMGFVNFGFSQVNDREVSYHVNGWGTLLLPNPEKSTIDTFEVLLRKKIVTETQTFIDGAGNLLPNSILMPFGYTQGIVHERVYYTFYVKGANYYGFEIIEDNGMVVSADYNNGIFETLPERIFVHATASGAKNGISWSAAYSNLNEAIADSKEGDEIWVAEGIYVPGGDTPTLNAYFDIPDGVKLYGGFVGTETELGQRSYVNNLTVLSGDLEANDYAGDVVNNRGDNANHIMVLQSNVTKATVIDGFTFLGGHSDATGSIDNRSGGAILSYGSPYLINNTFIDNYASCGGAICFKDNAAAFTYVDNCTFIENEAGDRGGAISVMNAGGTFEDCAFYYNECLNFGGGAISVNESDLEILGCVFERNKAAAGGAIRLTNVMEQTFLVISYSYFNENKALLDGGGAIYNSTPSSTIINDCMFKKNESLMGGAIFSILHAITTIEHSVFNDNISHNSGGAIATFDKTYLSVFSTIFDRNQSSNDGGAIYCIDTESHLMNTLIMNNKAISGNDGGAIANVASVGNTGSMEIINSTIANNHGGTVDGIVQYESNNADVSLTLINTILNHIHGNYAIQYGTPKVLSLGGNLSSDLTLQTDLIHSTDQNQTDALFVDETNNDFKLMAQSPAINAGVMANATVTDIEGTVRNGIPDVGAYEMISTGTVATKPIVEYNNDLKTFPNPATDYTTLEIDNDWTGMVHIQIINTTGQILRKWEIKKEQRTHQEQILLDKLATGTYQIVVEHKGKIQINNIIKL